MTTPLQQAIDERDLALAECERFRNLLEAIVESWDNHTFQQERHVVDAEMGSYWSPSTAMVDAECIANVRSAIDVARKVKP